MTRNRFLVVAAAAVLLLIVAVLAVLVLDRRPDATKGELPGPAEAVVVADSAGEASGVAAAVARSSGDQRARVASAPEEALQPPQAPQSVLKPGRGPGWYLDVTLHEAQGRPIAGAISSCRHSSRQWPASLGLGPSDEEGRSFEFVPIEYLIGDVPIHMPASISNFPGALEITARPWGYRTTTAVTTEPLPSPHAENQEERIVTFELVLEPAAFVRGRVLGPDGAPVPEAVVDVRIGEQPWRWGGEGGRRSFVEEIPERMTDTDGRYAIPVDGGGQVFVHAMRSGIGTASAGPILVPSVGDAQAPDLFLLGAGELRGIVLSADRQPLPEVRLYAFLMDRMEPYEWNGFCDAVLPTELLVGRAGLPVAQARTGSDGIFSIAGLEPGRYGIYRELPDQQSRPPLATGETGGGLIEVPWESYRLHVIARDEAGRAVSGGCSYEINTASRSWGSLSMDESGTWLDVCPGEVFVHVRSGDRHAEQWVQIPEGQYESRLELTVRKLAMRLVVLRIEGPEGERVGTLLAAFRNHDRSFAVDAFLLKEREGRPGYYWIDVPLGSFDLELYSLDERFCNLELAGGELVGSEDAPLVLQWPRGGRYRVAVLLADEPDPPPNVWVLVLSADGVHNLDNHNRNPRSGPFEPRRPSYAGNYLLEARAEGYATVRIPLRIEDGSTTQLAVDLHRD